MLTFVCSLWHGWRPVYTEEHVYRAQALIEEFYPEPHRFVCMTNWRGLSCETVPLQNIPWKKQHKSIPNCFARMWLFSEEALTLGERVVSLDLDFSAHNNIAPLFGDEDFKIVQGTVAPYNGSMFQVRPGAFPELWDTLNETTARQANKQVMANGRRYYGSDQAWMSYKLPNRPTWGKTDGVYQHVQLTGTIPDDARLIFYAGMVKPWDLEERRRAHECAAN